MANLAAHVLFWLVGYPIASLVEWFIHCYCMHAIDNDKVPTKVLKRVNKQHLIHHAATNNSDMTVNPTVDKYKKAGLPMKFQRFQGLYFVWPVTVTKLIGAMAAAPFVNSVLRAAVPSVLFTYDLTVAQSIMHAAVLATYMSLMWNYIHPTLHHEDGLPLSDGLDLVPRQEWMKQTFWFKYLWKHHVLHHLLVGSNAGNFNVTLPGADWMMGTLHNSCDGWKVDADKLKIYKVK